MLKRDSFKVAWMAAYGPHCAEIMDGTSLVSVLWDDGKQRQIQAFLDLTGRSE